MADTNSSPSMFDNLMSGISGLGSSLKGWINGTNTSSSTLSNTGGTLAPATNAMKMDAINTGDASKLYTPSVDTSSTTSSVIKPTTATVEGFNPNAKFADATMGEKLAYDKQVALDADKSGGMLGLDKSTINNGIGLANLGKDVYGMFNASKMTKAALNNLNTQTNIMNKNEARTAEEFGRIKEQRANNTAAYGGR